LTGLLVETADGSSELRFSHALVRDALYEGVTSLRRSRLHARIGDAIESRAANDARAAELAYHFSAGAAAGTGGRAVRYAVAAARAAAAQTAWHDAADHWVNALQLLDASDATAAGDITRIDLLLGLGDALRRNGELDESRAPLREAAELARASGDGDRLARAALSLGAGPFH